MMYVNGEEEGKGWQKRRVIETGGEIGPTGTKTRTYENIERGVGENKWRRGRRGG